MLSLQKSLARNADSESTSDTVAEPGAAAESEKKKNRVEPNQEPGTEASESVR